MEGYAEYAVQKKLKAKDRMPVVASVLAIVAGFVIWMFVSGPVGPLVILAGIVCTVITVSRQEIEYEYIFVNGDCEISKIVKRSTRKKIYEFEMGKVQKVVPFESILFDNACQADPMLLIRDFTSGHDEKKADWYVFFNNGKNRTEAVVLELNDRCVEHVQLFYKNKYME